MVILRGLPGSGKSYLARLIRDLEKEAGAPAPRILNLDDYFLDPSSGEYEYDAALEPSYRQSLGRSLVKTMEAGHHPLVVVDAIHARLDHFQLLQESAQSRGFAVFVACLEGSTLSSMAAANTHGWTEEQLAMMQKVWEPTPPCVPSLCPPFPPFPPFPPLPRGAPCPPLTGLSVYLLPRCD